MQSISRYAVAILSSRFTCTAASYQFRNLQTSGVTPSFFVANTRYVVFPIRANKQGYIEPRIHSHHLNLGAQKYARTHVGSHASEAVFLLKPDLIRADQGKSPINRLTPTKDPQLISPNCVPTKKKAHGMVSVVAIKTRTLLTVPPPLHVANTSWKAFMPTCNPLNRQPLPNAHRPPAPLSHSSSLLQPPPASSFLSSPQAFSRC